MDPSSISKNNQYYYLHTPEENKYKYDKTYNHSISAPFTFLIGRKEPKGV